MSSALADAGHRAELGALLELVSLPAAGPARLRVLLAGRSAQTAVEDLRAGRPATLAALGACRGVDTALIASWRQRLGAALRRAEAGGWQVGADRLEAHERAGVWLQLPWHAGVAGLWESDPEPPAMLFGQGTPIDATLRRVGIVGTRRCSAYGRTVARMLGSGLAAEGIAVVSGLATGIDGIAQRAALDRDGPVIGVVGSGLDRVYPAANRTLWAEVAERGTLLSEYPLGTQAVQWHFPARNRILAALCEVLVVVESGPSGGSMYTVDAAAERGRQVMAVPGPITSASSTGTNRLLAEGCAPVCGVDDVLVALGEARGDVGVPAARELPDDPLSRRILDELTGEPRSVDQLVMGTGASLGELASTLGRMQLSGWVVETGGWWEKAR